MSQSITALIFVACVAGGLGWDFGDTGNYLDTGNSWSDPGSSWSDSGNSWSQPSQSDNSYGGGDHFGLQPSFDQGHGGLQPGGDSWSQPSGGDSWSQPSGGGSLSQPSSGNSWGGNDQFALTPIGPSSGQDSGLGGSGGWMQPGGGGDSWSQSPQPSVVAPSVVAPSVIGSSSGSSGNGWGQPNPAPAQESKPFTGTVLPNGHTTRLPPACVEKIREMVQNRVTDVNVWVQVTLSPLCYKPEDWV